jgi:hypothetical protein
MFNVLQFSSLSILFGLILFGSTEIMDNLVMICKERIKLIRHVLNFCYFFACLDICVELLMNVLS